MNGLFRADDVRAFDAAAIAGGVPGHVLMERAAAAALRELRAHWPAARDLLVLCGGGNNGGDGYVLARLAKEAGLAPRVLAVVERSRLKNDAARAADECIAAGVTMLAHEPRELAARLARSDVIVDALLGIGLGAPVRDALLQLITSLNESRRPVLAIDVPSGLCADSGAVRGAAVMADVTVTFIARKLGLWLGEGPRHAGEVRFDSLGVGSRLVAGATRMPRARLLERSMLSAILTPRSFDAHKGSAGHVVVAGGGEGMPGAARLAGLAALRAGAGRVTVLAAPQSVTSIAAGCAELMVRPVLPAADSSSPLEPELAGVFDSADAVALGPGLGRSPWGRAVFSLVLGIIERHRLPAVLDADALNLLAGSRHTPEGCVLTPHPGEAARLLSIGTAEVQRDRLTALRALEQTYPAAVVLKGAGSLVSGEVPWLCPFGNPAMAAPGMGDVLTGVIATLLGQGLEPALAARTGVLWHALAGDIAAAGKDRGVLASELAAALPSAMPGGGPLP